MMLFYEYFRPVVQIKKRDEAIEWMRRKIKWNGSKKEAKNFDAAAALHNKTIIIKKKTELLL